MLTSGQIIFDLKNKYIQDNLAKIASLSPEEKKLPKDHEGLPNHIHNARDHPNIEDPPNQPIPETQPSANFNEGDFKYVRNSLKLNQSAMHGEKDKRDIAGQKLEDLAIKADCVLLKVKTFWPITFFPTDIIIDPYKVNVIYREFFWSEHIHSIMVKDILDVVVETSLLFATIKFVDQGYVENTVDVTYLKRSDALKVRKIVQGLIIAHRQAVDLSVLTAEQIQDKAEELGKVKGIDDHVSSKPEYA